jgi:predicted RNA-binding Zn-ribbon protein involved in translation (DUF1610 family)
MKHNLFHLRRMLQGWLLDLISSLSNWVSDHIIAPASSASPDADTWRLRLGWWLEGRLDDLFALILPGSEFEEELAVDAAIPAKYLDERLRAIAVAAYDNPVAYCNECQWTGFIHEVHDFTCPSCGVDSSIYWTDRAMAWVPYTDRRALTVLPRCTALLVKGGAS